MLDLAIIGGGPAGLAAGLYAVRGGADVCLYEEMFTGGQIVKTHRIDNYPGISDGPDGYALAARFEEHAASFGLRIEYGSVEANEVLPEVQRLWKNVVPLIGDHYYSNSFTVKITSGSEVFATAQIDYPANYNGMRPVNVNNGDRITWKIVNIQPGMAMVVCSQSICVKTYHTSQTDTNWNDCALRQWLNNDFLKQYFSQEERNRILACNVTNSDNPQYKTPGGPQTTDKVFLLSLAEAEHIFADDRSRAIGVYWWLRTPGMYANYASG